MTAFVAVMATVGWALTTSGGYESSAAVAAQVAGNPAPTPVIDAAGEGGLPQLTKIAANGATPTPEETEPQATGSTMSPTRAAARAATQTGLPIPRFVSLKAPRVNVRKGPSSDHQVAWVFTQKGLPVEIIAEFELWRRVRDSEGAEGWVYHSMLSGRRTAIVAPWKGHSTVPMHANGSRESSVVALAKGGVVGEIDRCDGSWCEIEVPGGYHGYIEQTMLWGVYPGEQVSN
jgi:SH3-like domain-containing protein